MPQTLNQNCHHCKSKLAQLCTKWKEIYFYIILSSLEMHLNTHTSTTTVSFTISCFQVTQGRVGMIKMYRRKASKEMTHVAVCAVG